ncbi:hypothetical protein P7C71_g3822, partial [Lecanoromycetidae sp. Uapishka_2]
MPLQPPLRKRKRRLIRLPEHPRLELGAAGHGFPYALERFAEAALAEAGEVVCGGPEEVGVGEEEGRLGVLEVAVVCHLPTLIPIAARDQDALILESFSSIFRPVYQLSERRMALYKHACVERDVETLAEISDSFGFAFAAAVGEEDEGYALLLEEFESLVGAGEGIGGSEKDAIDAVEFNYVNCLAALSKCANLRHLDLQFVSESITMADLLRSLCGLSRLEVLHLPRSSAHEPNSDTSNYKWPAKLRDLHISGGVRDESTHYLETLPPSMTRLSIGNCPHLSMYSLRPLLQEKGPQLEDLEIIAPIPALQHGHKPLNDVMDLVPNLRHLKISLDFLGPVFFTPSASNPDACQSLRRLDLDCFDPAECGFITLEQVWQGFDWAEGKDGKFNKVRKLGISNRLGWTKKKSDQATMKEIDELLKAMALEDGADAEVGEDEAGVIMFGRR